MTGSPNFNTMHEKRSFSNYIVNDIMCNFESSPSELENVLSDNKTKQNFKYLRRHGFNKKKGRNFHHIKVISSSFMGKKKKNERSSHSKQ